MGEGSGKSGRAEDRSRRGERADRSKDGRKYALANIMEIKEQRQVDPWMRSNEKCRQGRSTGMPHLPLMRIRLLAYGKAKVLHMYVDVRRPMYARLSKAWWSCTAILGIEEH